METQSEEKFGFRANLIILRDKFSDEDVMNYLLDARNMHYRILLDLREYLGILRQNLAQIIKMKAKQRYERQ